MRSTLAWLHARTENVAAALLAAMFVAFMLQIIFRYVINVPLEWTQEACLTTWLWAVFWGAAFNLRERDHVRFDVLYAMGGRGARRIMALISALSITIAFAASLPILSSRLSISVSTRETKKDATERILDRSMPFSLARSRPVR